MLRSESDRPLAGWVAVVDDHVAMRDALTRVLRAEGIGVESFDSAEQYLRHAHSAEPCCLVLDVNLPGMSGIELHKELAAGQPLPPATIFISALDHIVFSSLLRAGLVSFLQKPFGVDELIALVTPHLTSGPADSDGSVSRPLNSAD